MAERVGFACFTKLLEHLRFRIYEEVCSVSRIVDVGAIIYVEEELLDGEYEPSAPANDASASSEESNDSGDESDASEDESDDYRSSVPESVKPPTIQKLRFGSGTRPPAILHVTREARQFALTKYTTIEDMIILERPDEQILRDQAPVYINFDADIVYRGSTVCEGRQAFTFMD